MDKKCECGCGYPVFSNKYAKFCQFKRTDKKLKPIKRGVLHKVGTFTNNKIKRISDKQLKRLAKYRPIRDKFLKENPECLIDGCEGQSELHHSSGRIGNLLWDVKYFRNLCRTHHQYYEIHPEEAYKLGISVKRL